MKNLRCRYVHLTNYSVNKKSKRYVESNHLEEEDEDDDHEDDDDDILKKKKKRKSSEEELSFKWPLQKLWAYLEARKLDSGRVRSEIDSLIL
eukprot:CAMPEP_0118906422 /NCGR_PEP_ID=MMETSP1166-20130328/10143_1 /TAXON_ID=1104430 /ORGANISM="Chrysoreinhardia sp, Strain CCMP3193" /LENGTH=91 /DNA_ID=CAMNT_0006845731 /DNA_START=36 /DNA_END=308 /DNA_ORIENTATION=+